MAQQGNFKGQLNEQQQACNGPMPVFTPMDQRGPQHAPEHVVLGKVDNQVNAVGVGPNKKAAEQQCAQKMCNQHSKK